MGGDFGRVAAGIGTGGLSEAAGVMGVGPYANRKPAFHVDAGPRPTLGPYTTLRDDKTGLLANPNYNLSAGNPIVQDKRALEALRTRALTEGPSTWAQLMNQKQALEEAQGRSDIGAQAGTQAAQARSQLAQKGGLTGGSAERIAASSAKNAMNLRQQLAGQGALTRANTALQDEQQRLDLLKSLPGMELQAIEPEFKNRAAQMQAQQFNIEQALKDKYSQDQYNMMKYQNDMQAWAAANQANAIGEAGGKKG